MRSLDFIHHSTPFILLSVFALGFGGCETSHGPESMSVHSTQITPPVFPPDNRTIEVPEVKEIPEDLWFLPVSSVSEPMTGSPTIPFKEMNPEVESKLNSMDFKPSVFPFNQTGGGLAFTTLVDVPRLEVQDLGDGRIRILARIMNRAGKDLRLYVGCEPTQNSEPGRDRREQIGILLARDVFRDFSFIIDGPVNRKFILSCDADVLGEVKLKRDY